MPHTQSVEPSELDELYRRFGRTPHLPVNLSVGDPFLTGNHQRLTSDGRRAEICYVLYRGAPAQGLLMHRKSIYPPDAYRLPTGGIHQGESVLETLVREVKEETDLDLRLDAHDPAAGDDSGVVIDRFLGTLFYQIEQRSQGQTHRFATYHFLLRAPLNAEPVTLDPAEMVADWLWRPKAELVATASLLHDIGQRAPDWADWGRFRATSHRFVASQLR